MRISRLFSRLLLIGCIVGAAMPCAFAQGGGGRPGGGGGGRGGFGGGFGGGMASLLNIAEVRTELKMDEESTKEFEAASKELREAAGMGGGRGGPGGGGGPGGTPPDFAKMRESMNAVQEKLEAKLAEILDPVQMDRLVGLFVQRDGTRTLSSKTIATRLKITDEQKAKLAEIEKASAEEMMSMFGGGRGAGGGGGGGGGGGDMRERMEKMRKESEEKVNAVLTTEQKAEMEKLKGAKFEFPAPAPRGGPGGRGNPQ